MVQIRSESRMLWILIVNVLSLPFTLVMVLAKKKKAEELFAPIKELLAFIMEPKVTLLLILSNIVSYIVSVFVAEETIMSLVLYPSNLFSPKIYTVATSGFLHADIAHLGANILGIFIFGRIVERKIGPAKAAVVYFGSLLISGIMFCIIHLFVFRSDAFGIGASGALMGLVSAAILIDPFYVTYELLFPLPVMVVGWLAIIADVAGLLSRSTGIGHVAHIGGFISIAIIMYLFTDKEKEAIRKGLMINIFSFLAAVALYYLYGMGFFKFFY